MDLLDPQQLQVIGAFVLGQLSALMLVFIQHWLEERRTVRAEQRSSRVRVIEEVYGPVVQYLNRMIDAYPENQAERTALRDLFLSRSTQLETADREHLWVALWDSATDRDLIVVRDQFQSKL